MSGGERGAGSRVVSSVAKTHQENCGVVSTGTLLAWPAKTRQQNFGCLLLLLLLCLLPRALMAWKIGGLCPDAVVYIRIAESFDQGRLHEDPDNRFALNLYPLVLMLLHRAGLDWELAGKLWNVAISCLTVLPLYGCVRRQFDDRVALAAGCLYALQSELIRWSPEGIRDPTFWFFMVLALYLLWRAASELRLSFYLAGGLALALAVMTRSEGLFLLVPLVLWSFRTHHAPHDGNHHAERDEYIPAVRKKLFLGVLLAVSVLPALLVLASLVWFRNHAPWELVRTKPLEFIQLWLRAGRTALSGGGQAASAPAGLTWTAATRMFSAAMFRGLTPLFALFMCLGVAGWWRTWKRGEHQAMFYVVLLFLLAIWIHLNVARETSGRYFLPVMLAISPFAALGLLASCQQMLRWAEGRRWNLASCRVASWLPLLLFAAVSLGNVFVSDYRQRAGQADLGRWTGNEFGPAPAMLGPVGATQVVAYYAQARYVLFDLNETDQVIENLLRQGSFDVILLPDKRETVPGRADLLRHAADLGYAPVAAQPFAAKLRNLLVLKRHTSLSRLPYPAGWERGRG